MIKRRFKWTKKSIARIGTMSDEKLGTKLQTSRKVVSRMRLELGIQAYAFTHQFWHTWKPREIKQLGTMTDQQVADKIGVPYHIVVGKRMRLRISSYFSQTSIRRPVKNAEDWTPGEIALLGTMTDARVAEKLGLGHAVVHRMRNALGIPPNRGHRGGTGWVQDMIVRLGNAPDRELAEELGISRQAVVLQRQKRGISAYRSASFQK